MSTSPWLQVQRPQQQQHKHHQQYPSIFRSATPPLATRPRSAATNSPPRGGHIIPRSLSVLHARPPSAPRSGASPTLLGDCDTLQPQAAIADQNPGTVGIGHHVQVDYSAIQRIADGVERMVRSWTSENSCRAQVYAKAYDSLQAAAECGRDQEIDSVVATQHQHHPPHEPVNACMDASSFNFNPLQSPAHPHSVEMSQSIPLRASENNLINVDQMQESTHGGQTSYAGTLSNNASKSLDIYRESIKNDRGLDEKYEAKVKELEISLLECATEYEVQLVEMKMKMLQMKSEFRQKGTPEDNKVASGRPLLALTQDAANVVQNNSKVNRQANASAEVSPDQSLEPANLKRRPLKEKYSENVPPSRPKTRPEGAQKKSGLEDSGKIVTCLQKQGY